MSEQRSQLSAAVPMAKISPVGFCQSMASNPEAAQLAAVAADVLADPILFQKLCDRVHDLLIKDLRHQRERSQGYGRIF